MKGFAGQVPPRKKCIKSPSIGDKIGVTSSQMHHLFIEQVDHPACNTGCGCVCMYSRLEGVIGLRSMVQTTYRRWLYFLVEKDAEMKK